MNEDVRENILYYLANFNHFKREVRKELKRNRTETCIGAVERWYNEFNGFYHGCIIFIGYSKAKNMRALKEAMYKVFIELRNQC